MDDNVPALDADHCPGCREAWRACTCGDAREVLDEEHDESEAARTMRALVAEVERLRAVEAAAREYLAAVAVLDTDGRGIVRVDALRAAETGLTRLAGLLSVTA